MQLHKVLVGSSFQAGAQAGALFATSQLVPTLFYWLLHYAYISCLFLADPRQAFLFCVGCCEATHCRYGVDGYH